MGHPPREVPIQAQVSVQKEPGEHRTRQAVPEPSSLWRDFEDHSLTTAPTGRGRAVDISVGVDCDAAGRVAAVVAVREVVENR